MISIILIVALIVSIVAIQANRLELLKIIKEKEDRLDITTREMVKLEERSKDFLHHLEQQKNTIETLTKDLDAQKMQIATILSQKKSSETRLGMISENLVPFLENFPYDPKAAHFLGNPIDYIVFDTQSHDPAVIFLEIKTGNSKLSHNQKFIKYLINAGKVRFEEIRISDKGVKTK